MTYQTLLLEVSDHIAHLTLNRPRHLNTFSSPMAEELNRALNALEQDPAVRVIVLKGAGKAYCAGIDLTEFFDKSEEEYRQWLDLMGRMITTIAGMGKPVIASARGFAVANGAGLIAAADLAVVAAGTRIGTTAISVGLFCMGPAVPLSRILGRKRALEMLLTGDMITADQALEWGLVNRVVPKDQLEAETLKLAAQLAAKSPLALQMGKRAYHAVLDMPLVQALDAANDHFAQLCITEDAREGVTAFMEKRPPVWKLC